MPQYKHKEQYDIISISHYFPPRIGGLENMAKNLLVGLGNNGIRGLAIYGSSESLRKEGKYIDEICFKTPSIFNNTYPIFGIKYFLEVIKILRNNSDAKVILHSRHLTSSILAALACTLLKHPYTVIEHNGGPVFFKSPAVTRFANWVDRNIFGLVLENAEDILAVSKTSKEWISQNFRIHKERIGVIYNSYNTDFKESELEKKDNTVVFASKWIKVKDPKTCFKAFLEIARDYPDWKFLMIGEGPDLSYDKDSLPKNVEIINKLLQQGELFEVLKKSKIYVNSSLSEGLALGIIEAVSMGNIPLLSDARSNLEISAKLQTKEFTFRKGNSKDLERVLKKAIYKTSNKYFVKELIERNSQAFSKETMIQKYYARLLPRHLETNDLTTLSIVIPMYNEENTIKELLKKVANINLPNNINKEIIIVDDCSKDNSRRIVEEFVDSDSKNKYLLLKNRSNLGKSRTVKKGVLASSGGLVVTQDADLEYDPNDLRTFVEEFLIDKHIDVIYGNRFNKTNTFSNSIHSLGNRFVTISSNLFTGPRGFAPKDMETCYKMVRGNIMRSIFKSLESTSNFGLEPELTAKLARYRKPNGKRLKFKQIDIYYKPRTISQGKKMRWFKHGTEALFEIFYFNSEPFVIEEIYNGKRVKRKF